MLNILILDDDPLFGKTLERSLMRNQEFACSVTTSTSAEEAFSLVKKTTPIFDVFLVDQRLGPGSDGITVLQELLQYSPESEAIVFASLDLDSGMQAYQAGAYRYLHKPFSTQELIMILRSLQEWRDARKKKEVSSDTNNRAFIIDFANILETAIKMSSLDEISTFSCNDLLSNVNYNIPLQLYDILNSLEMIANEIQSSFVSTSPITRRNALLQSNEYLEKINNQITILPDANSDVFGALLRLLIRQWRYVLAIEGGRVARNDTPSPVDNPYIFGNPVRGSLFVGRDDILNRFVELWGLGQEGSSVVLYGHRRMGKSSILQNLHSQFDKYTIIVDFNMQRIGRVQSTGELLLNLALKLYDAACDLCLTGLVEPHGTSFIQNPYIAFDRFLARIDRLRNGHRFIVTIDEFELIEEQINEGRLDEHLLAHWRGTFMTYPWFIMAFAGLHRLEELRYDYWHPLFGSVSGIEVSFLSYDAARRLITQPSPDFAIDYDNDAIDMIIELTHGQPYLIQLICHALVTRFNRQTFEQGIEHEPRFHLSDVEAIIEAPELFRDGNAYFRGVWVQAEMSAPNGQLAILRAISEQPLKYDNLANISQLQDVELLNILRVLQDRAVITERDGYYSFTVELMRRWVARFQV